MLSRWSIRQKLLLGTVLLVISVGVLAFSSFQGVYAYRGLAKNISSRAAELPLAISLAEHAGNLRMTLNESQRLRGPFEEREGADAPLNNLLREHFRDDFEATRQTAQQYDTLLKQEVHSDGWIGDTHQKRVMLERIQQSLERIDGLNEADDWVLGGVQDGIIADDLITLQEQCNDLSNYLKQRMGQFAGEVRSQYRTWIFINVFMTALSLLLLGVAVKFFYDHIFCPLRVVVQGSRRVAGGDFDHRIELNQTDEMAQLADALNAMTGRFQQVRDDLDRQVHDRTMEVVRSEQLASLGVLAAGVAHEINNPLASIAFCAEALESRLLEMLPEAELTDEEDKAQLKVLRNYLQMIQNEAFRSKQITERLLDFSRRGDSERHRTEIPTLIESVVDIVRHLGKYQDKEIVIRCEHPVIAMVAPQEIKQVILNLITNALEAVEDGGVVRIDITQTAGLAEISVTDDGCGMDQDVLEHLFEPFFTSREEGQGTGLGLAISYRIIEDHGGRIVATSDGVGCGSEFRVTLPLHEHEKNEQENYQAA